MSMLRQADVRLALVICRGDDEPYRGFRMRANHLQSRFNVCVIGHDDHVLDATGHCIDDRVHRQIYIALLFFQFPDRDLDTITRPLLGIICINDFRPRFSERVVAFHDLYAPLQVLAQRLVVLLLAAKRVAGFGSFFKDWRSKELDGHVIQLTRERTDLANGGRDGGKDALEER